jgi:hypothetical protein
MDPVVEHHVAELLAVMATTAPMLVDLLRAVLPELLDLEAEALATRRVLVVSRAPYPRPIIVALEHRGVLLNALADAPEGSDAVPVREELRRPPPPDHFYLLVTDNAEDMPRSVLVPVDLPAGDPRRRPLAS